MPSCKSPKKGNPIVKIAKRAKSLRANDSKMSQATAIKRAAAEYRAGKL